ncbi:MAG: AbrB/MazE/SpoVT family DNA-binding domain-containing protein [Cyclobacteriaceae bacterium]|nr:AbrB/MazE/SpoVT family DNA-binding domain-containing protein [Cyclobacteriaceae bacterium]
MANRSMNERHVRSLNIGAGGNSYTVTIPREYISKLGWEPKQRLNVNIRKDKIVITEGDFE